MNAMIRPLLLLALLLSTTGAMAQKCKYDLDKTDPMSGERVRRMEMKHKPYFIVSYYRKAEDFRVELNVRFVGERNFAVSEGAELKLKLKGGDILTFPAAQQATPISGVNGTQINTIYAITYGCTREQMQRLANEGYTVASAQVGDETLTVEVKEKEMTDTAANAACMLTDR